jgi:glycosyltransferase involved in cell wall biosynthesis
VLVVDDGSTDGTGTAAAGAGARVVTHPYNKGNGAAVKSAIRAATGEWLVIVDGDGQHRAADVARLIAPLGEYDLVIGARSAGSQATTGRRIGNAVLNGLASYLTERPIPDLTSGLRAARCEYLREFIHLLPNGFSTPTTTTLAFIKAGYNVAFEPVGALPRVGTSKIRLASDGAKFLLILLKVITIFSPLRVFAPVGAAAFALGTGYGLWNFAYHDRIPNGAVLLLMFSVIVMLVGLVSEQIASLRFEGRR